MAQGELRHVSDSSLVDVGPLLDSDQHAKHAFTNAGACRLGLSNKDRRRHDQALVSFQLANEDCTLPSPSAARWVD